MPCPDVGRGRRCCRDRRGLAVGAGAAPQKRCMTHPAARRAARRGKRLEGRAFRGNRAHAKISGKRRTSLTAPAPQLAAAAGMCTPWHATENEWPGRQTRLLLVVYACQPAPPLRGAGWQSVRVPWRAVRGGACLHAPAGFHRSPVFAATHRPPPFPVALLSVLHGALPCTHRNILN